jgi:hypothetical protein
MAPCEPNAGSRQTAPLARKLAVERVINPKNYLELFIFLCIGEKNI